MATAFIEIFSEETSVPHLRTTFQRSNISCTLSKTKCDNGQTTEICGCLEREKINQINSFSENVLLAYIGKLSKDSKSSNVRRMYIVDISQYAKVKTFKRFKSKKGKYHHNNFKHLFTMYLTINSYLRRQWLNLMFI